MSLSPALCKMPLCVTYVIAMNLLERMLRLINYLIRMMKQICN